MPDVKITVKKVGTCNDYCWGLYRSDRDYPILGGLTKQQANNHRKIMLNLIESTTPLFNNKNKIPSSIG